VQTDEDLLIRQRDRLLDVAAAAVILLCCVEETGAHPIEANRVKEALLRYDEVRS
jgi:hypothetical protein